MLVQNIERTRRSAPAKRRKISVKMPPMKILTELSFWVDDRSRLWYLRKDPSPISKREYLKSISTTLFPKMNFIKSNKITNQEIFDR